MVAIKAVKSENNEWQKRQANTFYYPFSVINLL